MNEGSKSKARKFLSFDGKNLLAGVGLLALVFLVGGVMAQAQSVPDVAVNSNGVTINTGTLDVQGNDIEDAGTTLYDAASGQIATSVIDYSATTASDVGLGNVENIALSSIGGNDITWDGTNDVLNVDSSSIQSGTTASDVGLGNADNADELDLDGSESMNGDLDMGTGIKDILADSTSLRLNGIDTIGSSQDQPGSTGLLVQADDGTQNLRLEATSSIQMTADNDGSSYQCEISESTGDWTCDGTKDWRHDINSTHNAIYSSQESPEVRAVYEGQTTIQNGATTVSLPSHFEKTVSDTKPMLRVQATPHDLATVAVTERSDSSLTIEASKDVTVDYRVTGIREGYEDKQVVREKE